MDSLEGALRDVRVIRDRCHELTVAIDELLSRLDAVDDARINAQSRIRVAGAELRAIRGDR